MLKDIPGFEDRYAITKDGKVWSYPKQWGGHKHNGMWLKQSIIGGGYPAVNLIGNASNDFKSKAIGVHRLVAMTYIENPENKPHVNHIDYNRKNPNVNNLEWVTRSENTLHSAKIGAYARRIAHKYTEDDIKLIKKLSNNGLSNIKISRQLNIPPTTVSAICRGIMRNSPITGKAKGMK